jgi:hypothetical protein
MLGRELHSDADQVASDTIGPSRAGPGVLLEHQSSRRTKAQVGSRALMAVVTTRPSFARWRDATSSVRHGPLSVSGCPLDRRQR